MSDYIRPPLRGMTPEPQSLSSLCWYACFRMLYQWNGSDPDTIITKLEGAGIDIADAKQTGLKLKDNKKAAVALGMNCMGFGQPVTLHNLKTVLAHSPVWATGQWYPSGNHVVVLTAASTEWVEYYDPWWVGTPSDVTTVKKRPTDWFLHGDKSTHRGLAHTHQWYPLIYWKQSSSS